MTIEERIKHLKDWCNGGMIANLLNKYNFEVRDVFPYKSASERPKTEIKDARGRLISWADAFHCSHIKDDGAHIDLRGYLPLNGNDRQVHNIEIRYPRIAPQITFRQYLQQQTHTPEYGC